MPFLQLDEIAIPRDQGISYRVQHEFTYPLELTHVILDTDEYDQRVWPTK